MNKSLRWKWNHLVQRYQIHSDFISQVGSNLKSYVIHGMDDELQIPTYLRGFSSGYHRIYYGLENYHIRVRVMDEVKFLVAYRIALHQQRLGQTLG